MGKYGQASAPAAKRYVGQNMNKYIGLSFVVALTGPVLWLIWSECRGWYRLSQEGVMTTATIINMAERDYGAEQGYHHFVQFEYTVNDKRHTTQEYLAKSWVPVWFFKKYKIGDQITVRYYAKRPRLVRIVEDGFVDYGLQDNKQEWAEAHSKSSLPNQAL